MTTEYVILILAIFGQLSDLITTYMFLQLGFLEGNPVWGTDPNLWLVSLFKFTILLVIFYFLTEGRRKFTLSFSAIAGFGAGLWNLSFIIGA